MRGAAQRRRRIMAGGVSLAAITAPTDLTGVAVWLKADAGTYQDTGAVTPASANNDPVGLWQDQSGNARHVSQATAGSRPALKTNALNGLPLIQGDGVDDYLKASAFTLNQPVTIICVLRMDTGALSRRYFDGNTADRIEAYQRVNAGDWTVYAGTANIDFFPSGLANGSAYLMATVVNGANSRCRMNAGNPGTGNPGAGSMGGLTVFARGDNAVSGAVSYGEIIIYSRALQFSEEQQVRTYLNSRWAVF